MGLIVPEFEFAGQTLQNVYISIKARFSVSREAREEQKFDEELQQVVYSTVLEYVIYSEAEVFFNKPSNLKISNLMIRIPYQSDQCNFEYIYNHLKTLYPTAVDDL
jgi:hypothetical protein